MKQIFRTIKTRINSLLYPHDYVCPICGREATLDSSGVCKDCREQLRHCGSLLPPVPLDGLFAAYAYDPILRKAMHRFKYNGQTWLARFFLQDTTLPTDINFDAIVPVPMYPLKAYRRGYNPPEALALALQEQYPKIPIRTDLLIKVKATPSQTTLTAEERSHNVKDVFRASASAKGLTILLIDDVTTTGSTLISCAAALKAAGTAQIYAMCACKARVDEDTLIDNNETVF